MNQEVVVRAVAAELAEAEHDMKIAFDQESEWAARGRRLAAVRIARAVAESTPDPDMFLNRCGVPKCTN